MYSHPSPEEDISVGFGAAFDLDNNRQDSTVCFTARNLQSFANVFYTGKEKEMRRGDVIVEKEESLKEVIKA